MDEQIKTRDGQHESTVLELSGRFVKELSPSLFDTLGKLEKNGQIKLVVSCKDLEYLSSEVSGVFLSHLIRVKKSGGDIRFCNVSEQTRSALIASGLSKLLVIYNSEDEASRGFSKPPRNNKEETDKSLSLEQEHIGDHTVVLSPIGSLDRHTIELLDQTLSSLLDQNRAKIVVNGTGLNYISSNGMGVFIGYLEKVYAKNGDLRFYGLNDLVRTVITTLGLHRLFQIFETRADALDSFAPDHE